MTYFRGLLGSLGAASALLFTTTARAEVYSYVDWTAADPASGTASGTITLPDDSTVEVSFAAINEDASPGTLFGAQVDGGTNFWSPDAPYLSTEVENAPPTADILQLSGGLNQTYKVTLSEPIKDPLMAIVSLGQASVRCSYDFDSPFTIVSQGVGYWGGSDHALAALPEDILEGYEGHGTIRFVGTFSTFSWTVPTPESWHGFTFAIRTTEALEPTPGAGGAGGADGGAGEGGASAGEAAGGESTAGQSNGGAPSEGGTPSGAAGRVDEQPTAAGGDGEGGDGTRPHEATRDEGGCGCSVPRGPLGTSMLGVVLALGLGLARRRARPR